MKFTRITRNHFFALALIIALFSACNSDDENSDSNPVEIIITAEDINFTISENPETDQIIGQAGGTTNEGNLSYSISEMNPSGAININEQSGEIKVADSLLFDFEQHPLLSGKIKLSNGEVSELINIAITITNLEEPNIFEGDVELLTQQEVDSFGLNNYNHINGSLYVGKLDQISDINNLEVLSTITNVQNTLGIFFNSSLESLSGLQNITSAENLEIEVNVSLTDIGSLSQLTSLNELSISKNFSLESLHGLENIEQVSNLTIEKCASILTLSTLESLHEVRDYLKISKNNSLENIEILSNLDPTYAPNMIFEGASITNLEPISHFTILKNLELRETSLSNLDPLTNLIECDELWMFKNLNVVQIDGLSNVTKLPYISIFENPILESIQGLQNVSSDMRNVFISKNQNLSNIDLFNQTEQISETITIGLNNSLQSINLFSNLMNAQNINIRENSQLQNLSGFENLYSAEEVFITDNPILDNFCTLKNFAINGIRQTFVIYNNAYNPTEQDFIDGNCSL